jgi:nucleolar protein 56
VKVSIVECVVGFLAFDRENRIVESVLFPKPVGQAVEALTNLTKGVVPEELTELILKLREKGVTELVFEFEHLAREVKEKWGLEVSVEKPSLAGKFFRSDPARVAVENKWVKSINEYYSVLHDVSSAMARAGVRRESGRRDLLLSQAILTVDDLDKTFNLFSNRMKEWYGLYFPELGGLVEGNEVYMKLIGSLKEKERFTEGRLVEEGLTSERAEAIADTAETSMGAEIEGEDLSEIQQLATTLLQLHQLRNGLDEYVDKIMEEIAPNIRGLVGSTLGARLIAFVGGLENLAKKSASKIQVLGAEKALFRSFRTGTKPPKHGLIFQHKAVHQAPRWQRGKIARVLAGKLAIAARLDVYRGEYIGNELVEDFEKRVEEIKDKYAEPPKRSRRKGRERGR